MISTFKYGFLSGAWLPKAELQYNPTFPDSAPKTRGLAGREFGGVLFWEMIAVKIDGCPYSFSRSRADCM